MSDDTETETSNVPKLFQSSNQTKRRLIFTLTFGVLLLVATVIGIWFGLIQQKDSKAFQLIEETKDDLFVQDDVYQEIRLEFVITQLFTKYDLT